MNNPILQRLVLSTCLCTTALLSAPMDATAADAEAQYFVAHQVAKVHHVADLLIADAEPKVVNRVIADLIKHHKQGALIQSYHTNKDTNAALKEGVKDSLLSTEFSSWLNEKIANTYANTYSYEELKSMYQAAYKAQGSDFGAYLAARIKHQDDERALIGMQEELLIKELEQKTSEVLRALPKTQQK